MRDLLVNCGMDWLDVLNDLLSWNIDSVDWLNVQRWAYLMGCANEMRVIDYCVGSNEWLFDLGFL